MDKINELIENNYGKKVISINKLNKGFMTEKWIIESDKKIYILKKIDNINLKRVNIICDAMQMCNGLAPIICKTKKNINYVECGNTMYLLYEYIYEKEKIVNEKFDESTGLYNLGKLLAELHNRLKNLKNSNICEENIIEIVKPRIQEVKVLLDSESDIFRRTVLKYKYERLINLSYSEFLNFNQNKAFIHGDFYINNVLLSHDGYKAIDFDRICYFYREYEVLRAGFMIAYDKKEKNINIMRLLYFFDAYIENIDDLYYINLINWIDIYEYILLNDLFCLENKDSKIKDRNDFLLQRYYTLKWIEKNKCVLKNNLERRRN